MGLTAVNLGEQTASLSFTAYNANGEIIETTTPTVVAPKTKVVGSARALFSAEKMTDIAWIAAQADGSAWSGFLLWGDLNNSPGLHLSGINATAE